MDYYALANQLLRVRANLLQVPASQQLSRMGQGELFVLNHLDTHTEVIHPKDLSEKMAVSSARIAALLGNMEQKGLISRLDDPSDSRQVIVRLTQDGHAAIARVREEVIAHLAVMLAGLGPEDAATYIRIQEKIWTNFRNTTDQETKPCPTKHP